MAAGNDLLNLVLARELRGVFVVGTAKNVGKTVGMRAIIQAAFARNICTGITSTGRDGEAVDASGDHAKPRLCLAPGTLFATARGLLPPHPACEIIALTRWQTASGNVVIARARRWGYFELAGPAAAGAIREAAVMMQDLGARFTVVDGALDRIAALGGGGAAILAAGAASAATMDEAVEDACALAARLRIASVDLQQPLVRIDGALTASLAARLVKDGEKRQVVVADATHIVAPSRAIAGIMQRLDVRCERAVEVIAATVASIAPDRYFEPQTFAHRVAQATGLPVFDIYANLRVDAA